MINLNKQLIIYYYVLLFFQEFLYGDGIWGLALGILDIKYINYISNIRASPFLVYQLMILMFLIYMRKKIIKNSYIILNSSKK